MLRQLLNSKIKILISLWIIFFFSAFAYAESADDLSPIDQQQIVSQQVELLKGRVQQAQDQWNELQQRFAAPISLEQVNTQWLKQLGLNTAIAQSNFESIKIEEADAQQTILRLEKQIQDAENQLNITNVFGLKLSLKAPVPSSTLSRSELIELQKRLELERNRQLYLAHLNETLSKIVSLYQTQYSRIETILKSSTDMRLKEQLEKNTLDFQRQQSYWLQQLNALYKTLKKLESPSSSSNKEAIEKTEDQIFFANEKANLSYIQVLIARYSDQIHQYQTSVVHSTSISVLNKMGEQTQLLGKQLSRVNDLLKTRLNILDKQKLILSQTPELVDKNQTNISGIDNLSAQYKTLLGKVADLSEQFASLRVLIDRALQHELASRQGLPGFGTNAWLDVSQELLWVPTLTFQVVKNLMTTTYSNVSELGYRGWIFLSILEILWIGLCAVTYLFLKRIVSKMPDHELGHINIKWLGLKLLYKNFIDIAVIANLYGIFVLSDVATQTFYFLIYLLLVWLFFKVLITAAWLILVDSVHDKTGQDVRLYRRIRWVLVLGMFVTMATVFLYQLPVIFEIKDLFDRLLLLYIFILSFFLIKSWRTVPELILPYIDQHHVYLRRAVQFLGFLIPVIMLINSAIGLFGYVNLVLTITWYESIFLMVLVGYLILRGLLIDLMEKGAHVLIRHVSNGWLWTEAFLKPISKVLRIILFFLSWAFLFLLYGWDEQSPVVERLTKMLHYNMISVLNTTITPLSIVEVFVIISLLVWMTRWTREFVYRFLLSNTKDLGLRNSLAIMSQYLTVIIGILIILRVLGIDFRALTVVAGMFFFGVGLGLRDLFNNFACGFLLLIERPLRVGDIVSINGSEGTVLHIGSRAVAIRTFDHMELLVPNAEIFSKTFTNWTAKDNIVRTVFEIKINRHDNPHEIQKIIQIVLAENKHVLTDPAPEVFLKEMSDDIVFEVRYYVNIRQVISRVSVRSEVLARIWDRFEQSHIEPPYPHHEIVLKNK